ncbi:MAG: putative sulfate exporter family transporter [Candidatus Bathyarchaeota archaeon]|nr:putative sulfate exporter family transporter [Candidatus Bathyarchaeota archaeon]
MKKESVLFPLYKSEDWWALWLGLALLGLSSANLFLWLPKIGRWTTDLSWAIQASSLPYLIALVLLLLFVTSIPVAALKNNLRKYLAGLPIIFILSLVSLLLAQQESINYWGLEYVLWALLIGLFISNVIGVPQWLKSSIKTELFIKIGLVLLGAEVLLGVVLAAGALGLFEITVGLFTVWYFCYYLAVKLGLSKTFAATMASATSICGVSAAIATGGAIKADPKEIGYTISLVLLFSIPLTVLMPFIARVTGIPDAVTGAWIGGTIDTTPAVVAAGALYSDKAMKIASVVKMAQNVLIGVTAFILAVYWTLKIENKGDEKPRPIEIWYRFPKFVLGFIIASALSSFLLVPTLGKAADIIISQTKILRTWFFAMAFVCIGLNTRFKDLVKIGRGKPLLVFTTAAILDIIVSLISAYIFFGGIIFHHQSNLTEIAMGETMHIKKSKMLSSRDLALVAIFSSLWTATQIYFGPLIGALTGQHGVIQRFMGWLLMLLMARLTGRFGRVTLMATITSLATRLIRPGQLYAIFVGLGYALGGLTFDTLFFLPKGDLKAKKSYILVVSLISGIIASIPYMLYRLAFLGLLGFLAWLPFYLPDFIRSVLLSVAGTLTGLAFSPRIEGQMGMKGCG